MFWTKASTNKRKCQDKSLAKHNDSSAECDWLQIKGSPVCVHGVMDFELRMQARCVTTRGNETGRRTNHATAAHI